MSKKRRNHSPDFKSKVGTPSAHVTEPAVSVRLRLGQLPVLADSALIRIPQCTFKVADLISLISDHRAGKAAPLHYGDGAAVYVKAASWTGTSPSSPVIQNSVTWIVEPSVGRPETVADNELLSRIAVSVRSRAPGVVPKSNCQFVIPAPLSATTNVTVSPVNVEPGTGDVISGSPATLKAVYV